MSTSLHTGHLADHSAPGQATPSAQPFVEATQQHARRRVLASAGAALAGASLLQALTNLGFHALVSRTLSPADYGTLGTLLVLVLMLTVPLGAVQVAVATARAARPDDDARPLVRRITLLGIATGLVLIALAGNVASFLHLPDRSLAMLLAPYLGVSAVLAALRGLRLGERRVGRVATGVVAASVVRLAAGAVLAPTFGVAGALWASLAAEVLALALIGRTTGSNEAKALTLPLSHLATSAAVVGGLWLFTGVDTLLARHHLDVVEATGYVAAGTIARTSLALPLALVMASLASFAGTPVEARRSLRNVTLAVATWGTASTVALVLASGLAQRVLFGQPLASASLVVGLAAVAGISGLVTTLTYFHHARRAGGALWPWAGALVEITIIEVAHGSATQVLIGSVVSLGLTVVVLGRSALRLTVVGSPAITDHRHSPFGSATESELDMDRLQQLAVDDTLWRPATVDLSVVVPFYNPGESVGHMLRDAVALLRETSASFEIIAVSDGATDGSEAHVLAVGAPEIRLIVQPQNGGKGSALQRGFTAAQGRYVAFIDADGDIDPKHLVDYLARIDEGGDIVYASKRHTDSTSFSSPLRKVVSWGFIMFTSTLFRLGVGDTQTGCKMIRREVLADMVPYLREQRFALDLELFVVARRRGHRDLRPAPVHLGERLAGSTVTTGAIARTLRDALTIWSRLFLAGAYPAPVRTTFAPAAAPATVRVHRPATSTTLAPALIAA